MVANKEIKKRIEETLSAFKDRLEENERKGKDFWSDDVYGEGLQNKCEGLEVLLIPHLTKPKELLKYLSTEALKKSVEGAYKTVNEKGFIPTPYESYEELIKNEVEPPEFIDTVSYVLTASIHAQSILAQLKELDDDTNRMINELISKSIKWLVNNHIPTGGWSGFHNPTITHIYSTWSAMECLSEVRAFESRATGDTLEAIKEFINIVPVVKEWIIAFAEKQGDEWESDDSEAPARDVIYNVYGLDVLTDLEVEKTNPGTVENVVRKTLERWGKAKKRFLGVKKHYPSATNKKGERIEIEWEDESMLILSISALSKVTGSFKDKLSKIEYSSGMTLYDKINITLEEMLDELSRRFFERGLWTDVNKNFSIYMTERIIEAMLEYTEFLSPPIDVSLINEKIDSLIEIVGKIDQNALMTKLDTTNERIDNLENTLRELITKLGGEKGAWLTEALGSVTSKKEGKKKEER